MDFLKRALQSVGYSDQFFQSQMEHEILQIVLSRFSFNKVTIAVDIVKMFDEMRDQC